MADLIRKGRMIEMRDALITGCMVRIAKLSVIPYQPKPAPDLRAKG